MPRIEAEVIVEEILHDGILGDWWRGEITSPCAGDDDLWIETAQLLVSKLSTTIVDIAQRIKDERN